MEEGHASLATRLQPLDRNTHLRTASVWLKSVFALVFLGFLATTGVAAAGITWAAYRRSWRAAAASVAAAATLAAILGYRVAARVEFAGSYLPQTAMFWLLTVAVAGGVGALVMLRTARGGSARRAVIPYLVAVALWGGLALVLGGGSACNLDAGCY